MTCVKPQRPLAVRPVASVAVHETTKAYCRRDLFGTEADLARSRIGFLINPIAGMGGRVGLKGTDGIAAEAARLGAKPRANARAQEALDELRRLLQVAGTPLQLEWLTASGNMGYEALRAAGFDAQTVHLAAPRPSGQDTKATAERFLASGVDIVLFCGGDGTARDICTVIGEAYARGYGYYGGPRLGIGIGPFGFGIW